MPPSVDTSALEPLPPPGQAALAEPLERDLRVILVLVPFMPSLGWAIAVLLLRFKLSQMDVPARQAFVVALVDPEERTAASAFTNTARYVARPFGAVTAGVMLQSVALAAPFVAAGTLKVAYDVAIYLTFRRVPLAEDAPTPRPPPER